MCLEFAQFTQLMWVLALYFKSQFFDIVRTACGVINPIYDSSDGYPYTVSWFWFDKIVNVEHADSQTYVLL